MSTLRGARDRDRRCGGRQDRLEEITERRGGAEQVALALVALLGDQELRLRFGLDALGHDTQAEGVTERDGRAAHGAGLVIVPDLFDERSIDHDAVERTAAQLAERYVAGAEIVDEHAHAMPAQLMQRAEARA